MTVRFTPIGGRAALVALAFGLVATPVEPAAAHGPDPTLSGGLFGQNQALEFRWRSGSEPAGAVRNAILAAADDNNDSRASKSATFAYDSTAANLIGYGTGTCGVNGLACFTRSAPTGFSMWLREHGRVFDWGPSGGARCRRHRRTAATTPRPSPSMSSVTSRASTTT